VVIEDLHLADEPSLAFLEFVQVHFTRTPLVLIATCVTPILSRRKAQLDVVARGARSIALGPLSAGGARRLLRRVRLEPLAPSLEHEVLTLAGGNPSFIVGAARELDASAKELDIERLFRSPSALCNGIRHLLSGLPGPAEAILAVAAAMGMEFDARVVALVLDVGISVIAQRLSGAVELEVVRPCTETDYRFVQLLYREYLYRAIPDAKRRDLHWKIGTAMRQLRYEETTQGLTSIAFHLSEGALSECQASDAAQILQRVGDSELRRPAPDSAATAYAAAMQLARRGGWPSEKRVRMALLAGRGLREAGAAEHASRFDEYAVEIVRAQEGSVILGRAADVPSAVGRNSLALP
jgi:predicted ATPase